MAEEAHPALRRGGSDIVVKETAELLKFAGPVIVSRLGIMAMGLTDTLVVGRFSAEQLALHSLAWAPTVVVMVVGLGLLTGIQVMTAQAVGRGAQRATGAVLRRGLTYAFWVGLAGAGFVIAAGPSFLRVSGLAPNVAEGAVPVLLVFALSLPATTLSVAGSSWLEGHARPTPGMVMMWIANIVNLVLVLWLVPGGFGVPAMGAVGAAWGTFGARWALALITLAYIASLRDAREWGVFDSPAPDKVASREQRRLGYGAAASNFFEVAAFAGMNFVAGWVGALTVAAYAIVLNVASIVFMVPMGLAIATSVLVGRAYGARDGAAVMRTSYIGFGLTLVFGVAVSLVVGLAAGPIASGYTTDQAAIALAVPAMVLATLFLAPDAFQVVAAQALRARGDVWPPSFTHFVSYGLVMLPFGWWLAVQMGLGLAGIMWGIIASTWLSAGLLYGRFLMLGRRVPAA
jgi:MATE family multidrug resistance protein